MREHHLHHFECEFSYRLNRAVRSGRMVRFIESDCEDKQDIYRTFTLERIEAAVSDTLSSVAFSNRETDGAGFLDALELHLPEIADGLLTIALPEADENVLREMGSVNPKAELRSLVFRAKRWMERRDGQRRDTDFRHELHYAEEKLKKEAADFQERIKAKKERLFSGYPQEGVPVVQSHRSDQRRGGAVDCEYRVGHRCIAAPGVARDPDLGFHHLSFSRIVHLALRHRRVA